MKNIKFCLIGCGRISEKHLLSLQELGGNEVVGICDLEEIRLRETAKKYQISNTYYDYQKMLVDLKPDAVIICSPSGLHAEMGIFAAQHRIHVITEKPMSINLEQADRLIQACEKKQVHLFVVKQNRLNYPIQLLKKAIDKNRFGRIFNVNATVRWTRPQSYYDSSKWRGTWELDGGAFLNQASHYFDLLYWLIGPVGSVMAFTATLNHQIEVEDVGVGILHYLSGCLGVIEVTLNTYPHNWEGSITVLGEFGSVKVGGVAVNKIEHWVFKDYDDDDKQIEQANLLPQSIYGVGHLPFLRNVIEVLQGKTEPIIDGIDGRKSLEIILAMYKSAQTGQKIDLPQ